MTPKMRMPGITLRVENLRTHRGCCIQGHQDWVGNHDLGAGQMQTVGVGHWYLVLASGKVSSPNMDWMGTGL